MLDALNALDAAAAEQEFLRCCGSTRWATEMAASRPFANPAAVAARADEILDVLTAEDWLEAFAAHPKIGATGGAATAGGRGADWSSDEQAGMRSAGGDIRRRLAGADRDYANRFGYMF